MDLGLKARLFYEFNLEDRIPQHHLLRRMNGVVGSVLAGIHGELAAHYSDTGRPSLAEAERLAAGPRTLGITQDDYQAFFGANANLGGRRR